MNIFMLGWEFPPFISGGLGTACYGLTKAMNEIGHHVIFVLPQAVSSQYATHVKLATPEMVPHVAYRSYSMKELENVSFRAIPSDLKPYAEPGQTWEETTSKAWSILTQEGLKVVSPPGGLPPLGGGAGGGGTIGAGGHYGGDMFAETDRYARIAVAIAMNETFDVIHAHDWMTYPAGIAVARATGKPLVVHVHSTEFDRSGEHVNQRIYEIERHGVHAANHAIAVSCFTRNILLARYGAHPDRVEVVYNAIESDNNGVQVPPTIRKDEKIVLFLGRVTMQKGPEYFLAAAKKVLEYEENVRFVMAGSGDMIRPIIEMAAAMGIGQKVVFTGFLRGADVARIYKMADLYVMPSVSEPFGIAPLEAISHDVPVLISKQSGVSEILTHALKVDFWDIDEMANKIIAVLRHPPLRSALREHGSFELRKFNWKDSARKCVEVYQRAIEAKDAAARG